jgi:hypothetical protein
MGTKLSLNEINKQLEKKNLDADLKIALKKKKDILTNSKEVKK